MSVQSFCLRCGSAFVENAAFCGNCGLARGQAAPARTGGPSPRLMLLALAGGCLALGMSYFLVSKKTDPVVVPASSPPPVVAVSPSAEAVQSPAEQRPVEQFTPVAAAATDSPTPAESRWAGTWTGEPNAKGDRFTVVIEGSDFPLHGFYSASSKNGWEYRRGGLTFRINSKHPEDVVDAISPSGKVLGQVGISEGNSEIYGWVEIPRLTLKSRGALKSVKPEECEFDHYRRVADPKPYESLLAAYSVPQFEDAISLGVRTTQVSRNGGGLLDMRTYSYISDASQKQLREFYRDEVGAETFRDETDYCLLQVKGEGDAVTIEVTDHDDFRAVDVSKLKR